jgi:hypothetical protein
MSCAKVYTVQHHCRETRRSGQTFLLKFYLHPFVRRSVSTSLSLMFDGMCGVIAMPERSWAEKLSQARLDAAEERLRQSRERVEQALRQIKLAAERFEARQREMLREIEKRHPFNRPENEDR